MMIRLSLFLIAFLCCLSTESSGSPIRLHPSPPGCDVTIRGFHGGASGAIELQLGESQVRNRVGWWTTIGGGIVALETREPFSEVVGLDFGCNAHRRYRFYFEANVDGTRYQYVYYFPNEDDFTQQTLIDLGDVSRFFDVIEPGPEISEDEPLAGIELEGEWIRRESTYNPNDGMKMEIDGQVATLTYVPPTALVTWQVGKVIWQGVSTRGEIEVLGSTGEYYSANVTASGLNQLSVEVDRGGQGDEQTWVRGQEVVSDGGGADSDDVEVEIEPECAHLLDLDPAIATIVDPIVEEELTEQELVGLAVGIIKNGRVVHLRGYGFADRENEVPVTTETLFRWASISKTMTAVAAMQMWEDDLLDDTADIADLVPEFEEEPDAALTMWELLANLSGIEQYPSGWFERSENYPAAAVYDPIAALDILSPDLVYAPADSFHYSTMGFMLAGAVLERLAQNEYGG